MEKQDETAWLGGLLSGLGTIYVANSSVHLVLKTTAREDMLELACTSMGSHMNPC
jgi:hypothetical protein